MRLIRKGAEPPQLLAYRKTEGAHYGGLPADAKNELREALVREQGGLCCFCMQRIEPVVQPELKVKIAHWMPRQVDGSRQLDWSNLLAACPGNEGARPADQHCDTRQANQVLQLSPLESAHVDSLSYTTQGELRSSREELQVDIDDKLNLNRVSLCNQRKEAVRAMQDALSVRKKGKKFNKDFLLKALARYQEPGRRGQLRPFLGALEHWLNRKLRRYDR